MKYLVISSLLALGFLLIYSRIRPYIQLARKLMGVVNSSGEAIPNNKATRPVTIENKLIKCAACGTWIPSDRALGKSGGLSSYCSTVCLENTAGRKKQKLAG